MLFLIHHKIIEPSGYPSLLASCQKQRNRHLLQFTSIIRKQDSLVWQKALES